MTCSWPGCSASSETIPKVSFHRFPKASSAAIQWAEITRSEKLCKVGSEKLNSIYRLCSGHFSDNMYMNAKRTRLKPGAYPDRIADGIMIEDYPQNLRRRHQAGQHPHGDGELPPTVFYDVPSDHDYVLTQKKASECSRKRKNMGETLINDRMFLVI